MAIREAPAGKSILLVEDDYYAATELAARLETLGVHVAGLSPGVAEAFETMAAVPDLNGAILDINLGVEMVFPVADELERLGIPFIFATAYVPDVVPDRHADKIVLRKPLEEQELALGLARCTIAIGILGRSVEEPTAFPATGAGASGTPAAAKACSRTQGGRARGSPSGHQPCLFSNRLRRLADRRGFQGCEN